MVWKLVIATVVVSCLVEIHALFKPDDPGYGTQDEAYSKPNCTACETEECVSAAARILELLDTNTDPCDDFYQFACGGWIAEQIIPPDRVALDPFFNDDKNLASARNLLAEETEPSDLTAVNKAKTLYASCIAYASEPKDSISIIELIESRFGTWPLTVNEWNDDDFDLEDFLAKAIRLGVHPLIRLEIGLTEFMDNGKVVINHFPLLKKPDFALPLASYTEHSNTTLKLYGNKIYDVANEIGIEDSKTARRDADEIVEVEKKLAQIFSELQDDPERNFTLAELDENFGQLISWSDFIISAASSPRVGITDITLEDKVSTKFPGYLANMTEYFSQLPKRTQANYVIWRVIDSLETVFVEENTEIQSLLDRTIFGITEELSPEESCTTYVSKAFSLVVHRLLYTDKFPLEEMSTVFVMLQNIQKEFDQLLDEHDWVDEKTAKFLREKNSALATTLLAFEQSMNDTLLEAVYANVTVVEDNFITNVVAEREEAFYRNLRLLRKPYQGQLDKLPHEMVAQNNLLENQMEFTSVIFEPPTFIAHVPQSLNYGGMGVTFGHELLHAFDDTGYTYNKEGIQGDWWSNETETEFLKRHQCLIDQYSNFFYEEADEYVNGELTLSENIADIGGIKLAYRAYKKYVASIGGDELPLPGVDFTQDQLYFINFAQNWCQVENQALAIDTIENDEHSPNRFRVIGSVQNSEDFSRIFSCPKGSEMNPENKCEVW